MPPTPVTYGWLAGSSTWSVGGVGKQSSEPSSPDAETIVIPWAAASWNRVFSADACPNPSSSSHCPHDVVTTCAARWLMIVLITSYGPVPEFGPSYTSILACGASPITFSMSSAASPAPAPLPAPPSTVTFEGIVLTP